MSDVTFDEVLELAKQLAPAKRLLLAMRLEESVSAPDRNNAFRQALLAEHEQLRTTGAFDHVDSLFGKFATPDVAWGADELDSFLHEVGTEWEAEMNELNDDDATNTA